MNLRRPALITMVTTACALSAQLGLGAPAAAGTQMQTIAGARVTALADKLARGLVTGPDRSVAAAYQVFDQTVPAGEVQLAPGGSPFVSATYVGVPVAIRIDGKLARTVVAGYRITTYVRTSVAARDLPPGAVLAPSDLTTARIASNGRPAVDAEALLGRRLNVATPKGIAVYVEQTAPDAVVKAGQAAILVIHDGVVALMADVVARTGGAIGDTVTVVNPQTQKAIAAIVTGPNRVELTLPGGSPQ